MALVIIVVLIFVAAAIAIAIFYPRIQEYRSTCQKCKHFYDYDSDIEWHETGRTIEGTTVKSHVSITCTCDNCGEVKKLDKTITIEKMDKNGNVQVKNLDDEVRLLFLNNDQIERIKQKRAKKAEEEKSKEEQQSETLNTEPSQEEEQDNTTK
ncbi:MAG: hypothetical protein ACI4MS_01545 [Candidatus Coproplasma sp.]